MLNVSIPTRLVMLSAVLLGALVISNLYLGLRLSEGAVVLGQDARLVHNLDTAIDASKTFGDLKYWLLELAVSARPKSEHNALSSRDELMSRFGELERVDGEAVAVLRLEVGSLMDTTSIAIEAYHDGQSTLGDQFVAKGLEHILVVERRLSDLVLGAQHEVSAARDRALVNARRAVSLSWIVTLVASLVGAALTLWIVRSITVPLRDLVRSMGAITSGDLDVDVPPPGNDEIGAMTRTLSLFRDSLVERNRLVESLREAKEQAEAATRTKSQFLANMSHELRTPLNAVIGIAEMLHEEADDARQETFLEPLDRIAAASKHLAVLINEILDLSRIEAGRLELHVEEFDVAPMLEEVVTTAEPLAQRNRNRISIDAPGDLGLMCSDATRVRQILLNLLSNACKFTEDGSVTLAAQRETAQGLDWIELTVSDTGIGISEEEIEHLFEEFTQGDSSSTRRYGGSGLGLAISRRLCHLLGGDISTRSHPGGGASFTVALPVRPPAVRPD